MISKTDLPSLPGFYYDEAKRKYFRILPPHLAPPGLQQPQRVSKAKLKNERQMTHIRQSCVLNHPLGGRYSLQRELGMQPVGTLRDSSGTTTWAKGLNRDLIFDQGIRYFCYDSSLEMFHCSKSKFNEIGKCASFFRCSPGYTSPSYVVGEVVSLQLSPNHIMLVMSAEGVDSAKIQFDDLLGNVDSTPPYARLYFGPETFSVGYSYTNTTLWDAAANPYNTKADFAIVHSDGHSRCSQQEAGWSLERHEKSASDSSEMLAVDWLNSNVIVRGHRNGDVTLQDLRFEAKIQSKPIRSPSCVGNVRAVDQNRIVVAGLRNEMNLYDLRYPKFSREHYSTPLVKFTEYQNKETPGYLAGFDINSDLNLIAAACDFDSTHETVTLFDAASGKVLPKGGPNVTQRPSKLYHEQMRMSSCVRFAEDKTGQPIVMVASDLGLEEWSWDNDR